MIKVFHRQLVSLSNHCEFLAGYSFKSSRFSRSPEDVPLVKGENLSHREIDWIKAVRWPASEAKDFEKFELNPGDVVLAMDRPIVQGRLKFSWIRNHEPRALLVQRVARLRGYNGLETDFLRYLVASPAFQAYIETITTGVNVPHISGKDILSYSFALPPVATQQRIAEILSNYDRLIDNNNRRIALLEESIHQLYKEWFVHLHFPGYESVKVVNGIPEGWKLKKLEELGLLGRGKSKYRPRNDPSLYGGKFPFIQTGEVKEAFLYITNYSQTYNEKGLAQSKLWDAGTLLITIAANIAETAILTFSACFPDSVVGFIADYNQVSAEFIKYSIDTIKVRMRNVSTGAAQDNLSLEKIRIFDFLVPDKEIMQFFIRITNPIFLQMKNLLITNENLRQARDLLLPRLMNGSIAV